MKKIIIIVFICFVILITGGVFYLNQVYLPKTIKALIIKGIEEQTNTKVSLDSVKVNLLKGLVLKNLVLSYNQTSIINVKEASCIILPWAILQKKIIIPNISLNSAQLYIERKADGTFNLQDLFHAKESPAQAKEPIIASTVPSGAGELAVAPAAVVTATPGFSISIYRIKLANSMIIFKDSTFKEPFIKNIDNLNLVMYLSLPQLIKFKLSAQVVSNPVSNLSAYGEFKIPTQELNAKISIQNISPKDYAGYYKDSGLNISEGLLSALIDFKLKENLIISESQVQAKDFAIVKDTITIKSNLDAKVTLGYNLEDKVLRYSGIANLSNAEVLGIDTIDKISNISSQVNFDNSGLSTEKLTANVLGLPVQGKLKLSNFSDPVFSLGAITSLSLVSLQGILKDKFNVILPGKFSGNANLSISVTGKLAETDKLNIIGNLDFLNAGLKLDKLDSPVQDINGRIAFTMDQAQWQDLSFRFQELIYKTTGGLNNFKSPFLDFSLGSKELTLNTKFTVNDKLISVTNCSGRYLASDFAIKGSIDTTSTPESLLDLSGSLFIDLSDLRKLLSKFKDQLDKISPQGKVHVQFNLLGKASDIQNCAIEAKISSDDISLYGFKGKDMSISYVQKDKIIDIPFIRLSLYGGVLNAAFKSNLQSKNCPYWFNIVIQGVDINELKLDTPAKDKDVAGIIHGEFKASGFLGDIYNSEGAGTVSITKGKLWELDLFKGLGKLMFTQDFTNIVFYEGSCAFIMRDKYISTENLEMKSNMVNLSGPVKIGLDASINAVLNVDMVSELAPLTGTFKDVTKSILGQTNQFAVIKLSGTLKDPKYKFEAQVGNIIKGLTDIFFKKKNSD